MAAGGFREFVAGEILTEDLINDYLLQGVLVFAGTAARGSAITSPVEGQFSFLKDTDRVEFYTGSAWAEYQSGIEFEYLIIAGGGGGGQGDNGVANGGGGGAGGYRNNVSGELTGGSAVAEPVLTMRPGSYTVTVGAGGASNTNGSQSRFGALQAQGGGRGASQNRTAYPGGSGGAGNGGGSASSGALGPALLRQGSNGGSGSAATQAGGGGGAGAVGQNGVNASTGGNGGGGLSSSITGSPVTRGGGGGGGAGTPGSGGAGGGGNGGNPPTAGTVNTGGGGGGALPPGVDQAGGAGGSGLVVLKYPSSLTLTIGGGLTSSTSTSGNFKITTFTAGTDTVTIP